MQSKLQQKNLYFLELPYKIIYFIFAFFTYCNLTFMQPIMSAAVTVVLFCGVLVAIPRLLKFKGYLKMPAIFFALAFFVSFTLSAVANYKYGYSDNFKGFIWMGLHFFTIFACDMDRDEKEYQKEFHVLSVFFLLVMLVMSFASLVQNTIHYSSEEYFEEYTCLAGVVWGRLWGVFRDPNYASVFATIAIILSAYLFRKYKNKTYRVLLSLNIGVQLIYLALSDSRTGLLTLAFCIFLYVIFASIPKIQKPKVFLNSVLCVLLALVISGSSILLAEGVKAVNSEYNAAYYEELREEGEEVPDVDEEDRSEDITKDISNRRFDLWKSGVEIFKSSPILGVSFYNMQQYAEKEMPSTYLVNNDHGKFNNMHNMIFNILVGQGALGMLTFLAFMIYAVVFVCKRLFKLKDTADYEYLFVLIICIVASFMSSLFLTDVIYVNSPTSLFFWLSLGYLLHNLKRKEIQSKKD